MATTAIKSEIFTWSGKDQNGRESKGEIHASSQAMAHISTLQHLEEQLFQILLDSGIMNNNEIVSRYTMQTYALPLPVSQSVHYTSVREKRNSTARIHYTQ